MFKTIKKAQKGFTIIELLIVIAIIAILALLVLNNFQGAQAKARDQQRTTDINNLHGKLEEFYNENNHYPEDLDINNDGNLTSADFPGIDEGSFKDPQGSQNIAASAQTNETAANGVNAPDDTSTAAGYVYVPYDCTTGQCTKYQLKANLEKGTPDQYVKKSLN